LIFVRVTTIPFAFGDNEINKLDQLKELKFLCKGYFNLIGLDIGVKIFHPRYLGFTIINRKLFKNKTHSEQHEFSIENKIL
jgi:hypothetical protein